MRTEFTAAYRYTAPSELPASDVSGLWRASMDVICICVSNEYLFRGSHMVHLPACREFTPITMSMSIDVIAADVKLRLCC